MACGRDLLILGRVVILLKQYFPMMDLTWNFPVS